MGAIVVFDTVFILNPYTCILTPSCSTQPQLISLNYLMTGISSFKNYSTYDSKKLFLEIQVGCAGLALLLSIIYVIIYIVCRVKLRNKTGVAATAATAATAPNPPAVQPNNPYPQAPQAFQSNNPYPVPPPVQRQQMYPQAPYAPPYQKAIQ
ncbi:unnamed protein product [Didymodactylos carnosus]|uniref:Uncharacterized protein n=1 Tax=Didymodactylos carnosus TaxID=1234261 RepID=A0A815A518_9BILA|nr:unnamed protein product [Didymodactylos carnosus]CAF1250129.1 unnamed protein product [Didymodactylos carnosus]CAF3678070.1 unnamed protein product [Didymodactylos carnosus]CAF4018940.1 unnamed protein product [Didymodactylos carnosus]